MLEGMGFELIDPGVDVPPEAIVVAVKEKKPDLVGLSAWLTTTTSTMRATIDALEAAGIRERMNISVDATPTTQAFATSIGADLYAADTASPAKLSVQSLKRPGQT